MRQLCPHRCAPAAHLLRRYKDRAFEGSLQQYVACLAASTTVYVGNLAFHTTEEQIHELFSKCGPLRRIVMGLDKNARTPCGFCFVEYLTRRDTEDCVRYLNSALLDERVLRIDFDWGFREGRQFGRGKSGGQVRDEYRIDYDVGRGGYGKVVAEGLTERIAKEQGTRGMGAAALALPPAPPPQPPQGAKRGREEEEAAPRDANPRFRGERDDQED